MRDVSTLEPRRREPPPGWPADVFEAVVSALAAALVGTCRRGEPGEAEPAPAEPAR